MDSSPPGVRLVDRNEIIEKRNRNRITDSIREGAYHAELEIHLLRTHRPWRGLEVYICIRVSGNTKRNLHLFAGVGNAIYNATSQAFYLVMVSEIRAAQRAREALDVDVTHADLLVRR